VKKLEFGTQSLRAVDLISCILSYERLPNVEIQPPFVRFLRELRNELCRAFLSSVLSSDLITTVRDPITTVRFYLLCVLVSQRTGLAQDYLILHTASLAELLKKDHLLFGEEFEKIFTASEPHLKVVRRNTR
jgi:hypothetical protein